MKHIKENPFGSKQGTGKVPKGISVMAKSPAQLRGRSGGKPISGHVTTQRKSSPSGPGKKA